MLLSKLRRFRYLPQRQLLGVHQNPRSFMQKSLNGQRPCVSLIVFYDAAQRTTPVDVHLPWHTLGNLCRETSVEVYDDDFSVDRANLSLHRSDGIWILSRRRFHGSDL